MSTTQLTTTITEERNTFVSDDRSTLSSPNEAADGIIARVGSHEAEQRSRDRKSEIRIRAIDKEGVNSVENM